jgi:hypothetical protein
MSPPAYQAETEAYPLEAISSYELEAEKKKFAPNPVGC